MNNSELKDLIVEILKPEMLKHDWFLVDVKIGGDRVVVAVDGDGGFNIANCVSLSRLLESDLNARFPFAETYSLEVGSPGMDQPLKVFRQFKKHIGRKVNVVTNEGQTIYGILKAADENTLTIDELKTEKKKETIKETLEISFANIKSTTLVVTF